MGNNESQPQNLMILQSQNWIQAGQDQQKILFSNVNPHRKRLLSNILTQQLIQQYQVNFIAQQDYINYIKQLNFRKPISHQYKQIKQQPSQSTQYIYPIRYFINKSKKQLCTTVYTGLLYIDKVDLRLKQINDIPYTDLLYMYKAVLQGFKYLYEKVGYFDIQQEMIFITRKGQIKVWMNSNLSKNYPNFDKTQSMTNKSKDNSQCIYGSQSQMIKDLIKLIEKNSDANQQIHVPLFSYYLIQRNLLDRLSFDLCLQEYHHYLIQYNLYMDDHMRSISELFTPEEQFVTARTNYQQSHVNQITNSRINHIKKKFIPMQTIVQNQNYSNYSPHSPRYYKDINMNNFNGSKNYRSSQVSSYSSNNFHINQNRNGNYNQNIMNNNNQRNMNNMMNQNNYNMINTNNNSNNYNNYNNNTNTNIIRTTSGSITDLNKSHHSVQSYNNKPHQNQNYNYSINQYNNNNNSHNNMTPPKIYYNSQHYNQINNQNYNNNQLLTVPIHSQFNNNNNNNVKVFQINHNNHIQQQQNIHRVQQNNNIVNKVIFNAHAPPNVYKINSQQQQDKINIQKPHYYQQNSNNVNMNVYNTVNSNMNHLRSPPLLNKTSTNTPKKSSYSQTIKQQQYISQQTSSIQNLIPTKHPILAKKQQNSSKKQQNSSKNQQNSIKKQQNQSNKKLTKSNIKYHSLKQSYQIDQEIANDLEKFLGLKVN